MNNALLVKNTKKSATAGITASDRAKVTFNRLRRKIETLQNRITNTQKDYEKALSVYCTKVAPRETQLAALVTQFIVKIRELTRNKTTLTKKEKAALHGILEQDVNLLFELESPNNLHAEVHALHEEIYGHSINDALKEGFEEAFDELKRDLEEEGCNKFDGMDWEDFAGDENSWQEMVKKFAEAAIEKMSTQEELNSKPKTKKEILKEEKARQLEEWKNKGIGTLYKRLAKELHPDLEQNPERRVEKDRLMKQLTTAYEKRDLIVLLELESEWLKQVDKDTETSSEDRLKVYNTLLKDQIHDLENQLRMIRLNPRYYDLQRCLQDQDEDVDPLDYIQHLVDKYEELIEEYEMRIHDISGENGLKAIKKQLALYMSSNIQDEIPIALLEMIKSFQDLGVNVLPESDFFDDLFADNHVPSKPRKKRKA